MTSINFSFPSPKPVREILIRDQEGREIGRATRISADTSEDPECPTVVVEAKLDAIVVDLRPLFQALGMEPDSMFNTLGNAVLLASRLRAEREMVRSLLGVDSHAPISEVAEAFGRLMDQAHPAPAEGIIPPLGAPGGRDADSRAEPAVVIPQEAIEAAAHAQRSPSHRPGPPAPDLVEIWKRTARITLEAAAPLIVAAELERLANEYWSSSHLHRVCKARATDLRASESRGEGDRLTSEEEDLADPSRAHPCGPDCGHVDCVGR